VSKVQFAGLFTDCIKFAYLSLVPEAILIELCVAACPKHGKN